MFWPPKWTPNNSVVVTDQAWVDAEGGDPRFAPYEQDACFVAPWLARTDQDTRWTPGDPMMRVLLIGEPPAFLPSFNEDVHGAVIELGSVHAGVQRWEVVSYFDWYYDVDTDKKGCLAWCRLYIPGEGPDPPDPDVPVIGGNIDDNPEHGSFEYFGDYDGGYPQSWEVPAGIVAIQVHVVATGGCCGPLGMLSSAAGSGGNYSFELFSVVPGGLIPLFISDQAVTGSGPSPAADCWFGSPALLMAKSGLPGGSVTADVGGVAEPASSGVGFVKFKGGDGGSLLTSLESILAPGGGSGASDNSDGTPGDNNTSMADGAGGVATPGVVVTGGDGSAGNSGLVGGQWGGGQGGFGGSSSGAPVGGGQGYILIVW